MIFIHTPFFVSRDVIFYESVFPFKSHSSTEIGPTIPCPFVDSMSHSPETVAPTIPETAILAPVDQTSPHEDSSTVTLTVRRSVRQHAEPSCSVILFIWQLDTLLLSIQMYCNLSLLIQIIVLMCIM